MGLITFLIFINACFANEVLQPARIAHLARHNKHFEERAVLVSISSLPIIGGGGFSSSSSLPSVLPSVSVSTCQSVQPGPSVCARACGAGYVKCSESTCFNPGKGESCCADGLSCPQGFRCSRGACCREGSCPELGGASSSGPPSTFSNPLSTSSSYPPLGPSSRSSSAPPHGGFHSKTPNGGGSSTQSTQMSQGTAAPRLVAEAYGAMLAGLGALLI